jgi:hypothetical protein
MSKIYLGIGLALVLVFCGAASAATIPVNQLSGDFQGTTFPENCGLGGSLWTGPCTPLHELPPTRSNARRPVRLGESRAYVGSWRVAATEKRRPASSWS